jgi:dihydroorotate dehydrogenase (NAD+) catalytic subunit
MNAEDALEYLILGAKAVQVGTANFINPQATVDVIAGIERYMQINNIKNISRIIGTFKP